MSAWGKGRTTIARNYITELSVTQRGSDPTVGNEKGALRPFSGGFAPFFRYPPPQTPRCSNKGISLSLLVGYPTRPLLGLFCPSVF
jgi:hypothetical protein